MKSLRDVVEFVGGRAIGALPPAAQAQLLRDPPLRIDGDELDPGIQLMLKTRASLGVEGMVSTKTPNPSIEQARLLTLREALLHRGQSTPVGATRDLERSDVRGGRLRARHYAPPPAPSLDGAPPPLVVFFHGGGFVLGDLDTHDEPCRLLCRYAGAHVLSFEYRLAPEEPFPAAVEDAFEALVWAAARASELGADPACIAVAGDSAGGNLAAVVAQLARDAGGPAIAAQLLIYPVVDFAERRPSRDLFGKGLFLTDQDMTWCEGCYAPAHVPRVDPRLSPLRAASLANLPPAIVVTAGFDPLRDEGEAYARALRAAGTSAVLRRVPGLIHGFINMTTLNPRAREATLEMAAMLRYALAHSVGRSATSDHPAGHAATAAVGRG